MESFQSFLDHFLVVIQSAASFAAVQQSSPHLLVTHINIHQKLYMNLISHYGVPGIDVLLTSRKAVKKD